MTNVGQDGNGIPESGAHRSCPRQRRPGPQRHTGMIRRAPFVSPPTSARMATAYREPARTVRVPANVGQTATEYRDDPASAVRVPANACQDGNGIPGTGAHRSWPRQRRPGPQRNTGMIRRAPFVSAPTSARAPTNVGADGVRPQRGDSRHPFAQILKRNVGGGRRPCTGLWHDQRRPGRQRHAGLRRAPFVFAPTRARAPKNVGADGVRPQRGDSRHPFAQFLKRNGGAASIPPLPWERGLGGEASL